MCEITDSCAWFEEQTKRFLQGGGGNVIAGRAALAAMARQALEHRESTVGEDEEPSRLLSFFEDRAKDLASTFGKRSAAQQDAVVTELHRRSKLVRTGDWGKRAGA